MTTPHGDQLHQLVEGTFVGPVAHSHDRPSVAVVPIDWDAYDVPRLWDALRREADGPAWAQARGFENLAQLLLSQHDKLQRLRDLLADSWDPQTNHSAVNVFLFLDELVAAMADDAAAHADTGRGLNAILAALTTAKIHIEQIKRQWDSVTTDWVPEWWDHEADDLNRRARQIVATADRTAGDHLRQITVPDLYVSPTFVSRIKPPPPPEPDRDGKSAGAPGSPGPHGQTEFVPPPPVPGYDPVPGLSPHLQALVGVPELVPAVPGSPISVLPVPPGNPHAPAGGAYVLPGPGIGRGGWIQPMPTSPATPGPAPASTAHGTTPAGPAGVMTRPAVSAGGQGNARQPRRGHGALVWEVAKGVAPVIGGDPPSADEKAGLPLEAQDEAFVEWFADLATPWADDLVVEIRRAPEPNP